MSSKSSPVPGPRERKSAGATVGTCLPEQRVQLDAACPVRVGDRRRREGGSHIGERAGLRCMGGHEVDLDEHVLVLRVGVIRRLVQRQVDGAVAVAVDAARLPSVQQTITVGVGIGLERDLERDVAGERRDLDRERSGRSAREDRRRGASRAPRRVNDNAVAAVVHSGDVMLAPATERTARLPGRAPVPNSF